MLFTLYLAKNSKYTLFLIKFLYICMNNLLCSKLGNKYFSKPSQTLHNISLYVAFQWYLLSCFPCHSYANSVTT